MRVTHTTVEDFLHDVDIASEVVSGIVRCRVDKTAQQKEAVTFDVLMWLTAVVVFSSGDEKTLLEAAILFPEDDDDKQEGSDLAEKTRCEIESFCLKNNLLLRSGKIELF